MSTATVKIVDTESFTDPKVAIVETANVIREHAVEGLSAAKLRAATVNALVPHVALLEPIAEQIKSSEVTEWFATGRADRPSKRVQAGIAKMVVAEARAKGKMPKSATTKSGAPKRQAPSVQFCIDGKPVSKHINSVAGCCRFTGGKGIDAIKTAELRAVLADGGVEGDPSHTIWTVTLPNGRVLSTVEMGSETAD